MSRPSGKDITAQLQRLATDRVVSASHLSEECWIPLLGAVRRERLEGALVDAIQQGRLPATVDQREEALGALEHQMRSCVAIEALTIDLVLRLRDHGVEPCLLKGVATSHLDYRVPWLRFFADVDLLIRPEDLETAYGVLSDAGLVRRFVEPRPGFDRRFGKGVAFTTPDHRVVDVHRTLTMGALGLTVRLDQLWSDLVEVDLGGLTVTALGPERRFLHACLHVAATTTGPKVSSLRDMASLATRPEGLDLGLVRALAGSWRYRAVVERALRSVARLLPDASLGQAGSLVDALDPTRWERVVLRAYTDPRLGYAARSLLGVPAVTGWSQRAAYVAALAGPSRSYIEHRSGSTGSRWIRAARETGSLLTGARRR